MPICQADVWDVCLVYMVACRSRKEPMLAEPVALELHLKPTLNHAVPGKLGQG
jgi:hypothetical protein